MDRQPLIEFQGVVKSFGTRTILDGVNLKVYEGEVTTIIGLSGTGKSVTLKHIIGLLQPDSGQILYRGKSLVHMTPDEWNDYIGQISYMFQNNALFDSMTVFENVALPLRQTTHKDKKQIEEKVMARIEQTELTEVAHKYPSEISGGMQKRAALARALVTDPNIVLFDEPTTGQDPVRKNAILGMVARYQKKFGFTAVLISHEIPDVFFISNRILALYDRSIVFQGSPIDFENFEHPFMDELLGSIEGLEQELTGLYSRRHFKVRYQTDLAKRRSDHTYVVAAFKLEAMENLGERLGKDAAQKILRAMGRLINKHFGAVGAFTSRQTIDEIGTVLPFCNMDEADRILNDFTDEFQQYGRQELQTFLEARATDETLCEFTVSAGLAQGNPQVEIESIMEFARFNQKPIAQFKFTFGGGSQ